MLVIISALILVLVFFVRQWVRLRKCSHLPGFGSLTHLPLLGHTHHLFLALAFRPDGGGLIEAVREMVGKYGDVFRLDLGDQPSVVINSRSGVEKILNSPTCEERALSLMPVFTEKMRGRDDLGNLAGLGNAQPELRKIIVKMISDLTKKGIVEDIINEEAKRLIHQMHTDVRKAGGGSVKTERRFVVAASSVVWRIVTGNFFGLPAADEREKILKLTTLVSEMLRNCGPTSLLARIQDNSDAADTLVEFLGVPTARKTVKPVVDMIREEVALYSADTEGNFIERCLAEEERLKDRPDHPLYGHRNLLHTVGGTLDLFVAGTDTVANMTEWTVVFLAQHVGAQEDIRRQIQKSLDPSRAPRLSDKAGAPLLLSFMEEVLRLSPFASIYIPHLVGEDMEVDGNHLPAGTQAVCFVWNIHRSSDVFPDGSTFNARRFIDANTGEFKSDPRDIYTFSKGRGRCAGQNLARAQMFIFLVTMLREFRFELVDGGKGVIGGDPEYDSGMIIVPKTKYLKVTPVIQQKK